MSLRLDPSLMASLSDLARQRTLLAFDFDGTLAPIVPDRDLARMTPTTEQLLIGLCAVYPCAVITGRSRSDVLGRLGGAPMKHVVGNHGLEHPDRRDLFAREMDEARAALQIVAQELPGVELEDKGLSLSLHYRKADDTDYAKSVLTASLAELSNPYRVVPGHMVLSILPSSGPNKGQALLELQRLEGADAALFVGDDDTDEDAFALDTGGALVSLRIGHSARSRARHFVDEQEHIDDVLTALAALRGVAAPSRR